MIITIKNWKIVNSKLYFEYISNLGDNTYEIKPYKKTRSDAQNRYYRSLLQYIEKETWIDVNDTHEKMRMKRLLVPESWTQLAYLRSTSSLNTQEFTEYIEKIKNFMAEFWINLPSANAL